MLTDLIRARLGIFGCGTMGPANDSGTLRLDFHYPRVGALLPSRALNLRLMDMFFRWVRKAHVCLVYPPRPTVVVRTTTLTIRRQS